MEVEMKALMSEENINKLFALAKDVEKVVEVKSDEYFSFNGEKLSKPKKLIRLREVTKIYEGQDISLRDGKGTQTESAKFFFKENTQDEGKTKLWLTIKRKNTLKDGTEINNEYETQIFDKETIAALLDIVNYESYFKKEKRSIGFYLQSNNYNLHCELVNVNGKGPYLEIETIVDENKVSSAKETIKNFFQTNFSITKFDGRSWAEITNN